jgi:hypothetical protein
MTAITLAVLNDDGGEGGTRELKSPEEEVARRRELWRRRWEQRPDHELEEHIQFIKRTATRFISWGDIGQLWHANARDAIDLWKAIRLEARDEFISGHYAPADLNPPTTCTWLSSAHSTSPCATL